MVWTVDKIDKLRQLWGKGNTANQIAQIIGDVTRNAVIGKANRPVSYTHLTLPTTPYE